MPMTPYLVSQFAQSTMTNLVRECFGYDFPDILTKRQVSYIFNYLNRLNAKTVLLEFQYVDKDFLEDFSRYYAKRYGNDGHKCARMHFLPATSITVSFLRSWPAAPMRTRWSRNCKTITWASW